MTTGWPAGPAGLLCSGARLVAGAHRTRSKVPLGRQSRSGALRLKHSRLVLTSGLILGVLAAGLLLARAKYGGAPNSLPTMPPPSKTDRVLIVAPHCDDETLGPGGLIASAIRAGAKVRVVLDTNGDGFHYAASRLFKEKSVPPLDYVKMGLDRQRETLAALSELGLRADAASFLSYPDGGTGEMWLSYWQTDHRYTSPETLDDHSPYGDSLTPNAPYAGRALLDDLKKIIAAIKPTIIFCPHPNDEHKDHWAAYCYTLAALYELGLLDSTQVRTYLVHRGDWPRPRGLHRGLALLPPDDLAHLNTAWRAFPLDPELVELKHRAIQRYRSQLLVMRDFLLSFVRTNELFGETMVGELSVALPGAVKVDGNADDWRGASAAIVDPRDRNVPASGDVIGVYAEWDGSKLLVRLDVAGKPASDIGYRVRLHPLLAGEVGSPQTYLLSTAGRASRADVAFGASVIEAAIPLGSAEAFRGVMLAAETDGADHLLDQTAWALLRVRK